MIDSRQRLEGFCYLSRNLAPVEGFILCSVLSRDLSYFFKLESSEARRKPHFKDEHAEAQKNPFQGLVTSGRQSQDMSLILPNTEDSHLHSTFSFTLPSGSQAQSPAQKTILRVRDDLHIWILTPHAPGRDRLGPCAAEVCSWGNVGMSFIASIYETNTMS